MYTDQPIIAMTGNQQHKGAYYFEQGFCELLHKPFHKADLLNTLQELFDVGEKIVKEPVVSSEKGTAVYDLSLLKSFMKDDNGLKEIVSVFLIQTKKDMEELKKAVASDDRDTIRALSHRKLTMARQIQASNVVSILETLELVKDTDEASEVARLFSNLEVEMETMTTALETEISQSSML